ncbi:MAG: glycosyltransferase family 39 protein [Verrucomicrobiota bacterium]
MHTQLPDELPAPKRSLLCLLAGVFIIRLLYVFFFRPPLLGDESYYWDWGRRLDWGYFSKPPLIAWLMALVSWLGGSTELSLRIAPLIIGTASLAMICSLAKQLYGQQTAYLTALIALATPANAGLNLFLTIDAPLVFFWTAALGLFWSWTEKQGPLRLMLPLTITLGLGILSKQMMMLFPLFAILFLALNADKRFLLRKTSLWVCFLTSYLFLTPVLLWNQSHGWITLKHTQHHFGGSEGSLLQRMPMNVLDFIGKQAGILSPLIWFLLVLVIFFALFNFKHFGKRERYLIIFSGMPIAFMHLMSLRQIMQANWPAVYFIGAFILLAGWLNRSFEIPGLPLHFRQWKKPALITGYLCVIIVYSLSPALEALGYAGHRKLDPYRRMLGWKETATELQQYLDQVPHPEKTFVIALGHRYHASEMAFYLPSQPRTYRWEPLDQIASQYELWPNPIEDGKATWDALILRPEDHSLRNKFRKSFESVESVGKVVIKVSPLYERRFEVLLGKSIKHWPKGKALNP